MSLSTLFETRDGVVAGCFSCFKFVWRAQEQGDNFSAPYAPARQQSQNSRPASGWAEESKVMEAMGDSLVSGIYCEPTILLFYTTLLELCQGTGPSADTQEGVPAPSRLTRCIRPGARKPCITPRPTAPTHHRVGAHMGSC